MREMFNQDVQGLGKERGESNCEGSQNLFTLEKNETFG